MSNGAMLPVVNIRATDTGIVDGDEDIMRVAKRRQRAVFELDILRLGEDKGAILILISNSSVDIHFDSFI